MNTVNCALFLQKDQQATNGIVHIIDSVLDPSKSLSDNVADVVLKVNFIFFFAYMVQFFSFLGLAIFLYFQIYM